jgi:nucleoside-diphosphate-sugar epimerase
VEAVPVPSRSTPETLVLTGASGFVGRHLLDDLKDDYRIFAIARRSQHDCGAPVHPNIAWMRVDIADREGLARTFREIRTAGGARALVHLAAYYDFTGLGHPEYQRTNIDGTRNVLEAARDTGISGFVFGSSVAACAFPRPEGPVDEKTPPDGDHVYAWSKREGERLVREFSSSMPTRIARFGAIYSDWCEYPPLYVFLRTWLGSSWRSRIVAGHGEMAVPYIHIRDLVAFFRRLLGFPCDPGPTEVLVASTSGSTPLDHLYRLATLSYFGRPRPPLFVPAPLASMGLLAMDLGGRAIRRPPFERAWMRHYVDKRLEVDNRRTRECLGWTPNPRFQIERRLPFLIERLKSEPFEWLARNTALLTREPLRPDLRIYHALLDGEDQVVRAVAARLSIASGEPWSGLLRMDPSEREWYVRLLYRLLLNSVQNSNRMLLLNYLAMTARRRFELGFTGEELGLLLDALREEIRAWLARRRDLGGFERELYERVTVPLDFGKDEVLDQWERHQAGGGEGAEAEGEAGARPPTGQEQLAETIWQCLVQRR